MEDICSCNDVGEHSKLIPRHHEFAYLLESKTSLGSSAEGKACSGNVSIGHVSVPVQALDFDRQRAGVYQPTANSRRQDSVKRREHRRRPGDLIAQIGLVTMKWVGGIVLSPATFIEETTLLTSPHEAQPLDSSEPLFGLKRKCGRHRDGEDDPQPLQKDLRKKTP